MTSLSVVIPLKDERDNLRQVRVADAQRRHAFLRTPVVDDRTDLVAAHIFGDNRGSCQIGTRLAAHCVAPVAEAAVGGE